MPNKKKK